MSVRIRVLGSASAGWEASGPIWIESADPDAHEGGGTTSLTADPARALAFADFGEAMTFWRRESTVRPLRSDLLPNRPLTAFTVEIEPVPEDWRSVLGPEALAQFNEQHPEDAT